MPPSRPFSVNTSRFDPYKTYRFLVYLGTNTAPVAGVNKVAAIKRSSDVIEYKSGGDADHPQGPGRTKYEPITLEPASPTTPTSRTGPTPPRCSTRARRAIPGEPPAGDADRAAQRGRQPVHALPGAPCWVSEYQALPDLDAGANAVAIAHIKLENEGWEHDLTLTETKEL